MSSVVKIRVASKIDKELYEKMLKDIRLLDVEIIIHEDNCIVYYDSQTKMIGYDDTPKVTKESFNELKAYTVEDFYCNCEMDYDMCLFDEEEKVKTQYIRWFNKNIFAYKPKPIVKYTYDDVISELRVRLDEITLS